MLEKIPRPVGAAMKGLRSGMGAAASSGVLSALPDYLLVQSPLFVDGGPIPRRCTADGEGQIPELEWSSSRSTGSVRAY